jgi:lysophospholipase L1-like esterase
VAILGDSLTVLGWKQLYDGLDRHYAVRIGAVYGEGYNGGRYSKLFRDVFMLDTAQDVARSHPAIVVLALGTNDALSAGSLAPSLSAMSKMVAAFRPACMVGVTLPEDSPAKGWSASKARALNAAMRLWADQIVDWATLSRRAGMVTDDGIHTTPAGTEVRARALIAAVKKCSARAT